MPISKKEEARHNEAVHAEDMVDAETDVAAEIAVIVETIAVVADAETTVEDLKAEAVVMIAEVLKTEAVVKIAEDMSVANVETLMTVQEERMADRIDLAAISVIA